MTAGSRRRLRDPHQAFPPTCSLKYSALVIALGLSPPQRLVVPVPPSLVGKTLLESNIGARSGMNVIATRRGSESESSPTASAVLSEGAWLVLLGTVEQRQELTRMLDEEV